jgi:uncharacterized protein YggE
VESGRREYVHEGVNMEQPDTITIEVSDSDDVFADHADLLVTVRGSSLFSGQEALKKAREVRELVEGLTDSGLLETDILLEGISTDVSSGITGQRSSANYRLRVRCRKLDELADVLGVITSQKNSDLSRIVWRYGHPEELQASLLEKCLSNSKRKAEMVAASLGVELLGVHEFHERLEDREAGTPSRLPVAAPASAAFRGKTISTEELGLSVSHSKRVTMMLTTRYRVGPLKRPGKDE